MIQDVKVTQYIFKFGIIYAIGLSAISAISFVFDLDVGTGATIGLFVASAIYTVSQFIQDNKRIPNKNEKSKMVWFSFLVSWVVSVCLFVATLLILDGEQGLIALYELATELNIPIILGIFVFISLLHLAFLFYCYGGLAQKQYNSLKKKGKI